MGWYKNWGWAPKKVLKSSFGRKRGIFRSRKLCMCGGHNDNNPKSNLYHNATKLRRLIRIARRFKANRQTPLCPHCGEDYFVNETILPNGELGCKCQAGEPTN